MRYIFYDISYTRSTDTAYLLYFDGFLKAKETYTYPFTASYEAGKYVLKKTLPGYDAVVVNGTTYRFVFGIREDSPLFNTHLIISFLYEYNKKNKQSSYQRDLTVSVGKYIRKVFQKEIDIGIANAVEI